MKLSKIALSSWVVAVFTAVGSTVFIGMSYADEDGWHGQKNGWGFGRHCEKSAADIDKIGEHVKTGLVLNAAQNEQLDAVIAVIKAGHNKKQQLHKQMDSLKNKPAPEKLAFLEKALLEGSNTLQQLQPAFNAFYTDLSETQQSQFEEMLKRHRHGLMHSM